MTALSTQFGPGLLSLPLMVLLAINNHNLTSCSLLLHPLTLGGVTGRVTFRDAVQEAGFTLGCVLCWLQAEHLAVDRGRDFGSSTCSHDARRESHPAAADARNVARGLRCSWPLDYLLD